MAEWQNVDNTQPRVEFYFISTACPFDYWDNEWPLITINQN